MLAGLRAKLSTSSTDSAPQDKQPQGKLRHTGSIDPESNGDVKPQTANGASFDYTIEPVEEGLDEQSPRH